MTRLCGVIAGNVCHYIAKQPLLPFSLDYDGWKVWDISRDMVHSGLLRNLPCLDGVYLLDGEISPFYFGRSLHVCRRLRHHGQPWRTAICFTLGESELEEIDRQYLEFAMGLMLLLNGVVTRNKRLDYPKPNRDAAEYAIAFLNEALVPLWREHGRELGLPTRKLLTSAKQVETVLSSWVSQH